ncbi:hypothetical protein Pst134EA_011879 [Puccinia striiformis f. sp. tritici]|uniref:hypothetical protein n=1 Tax=Puccinia striiformis f. sp. tritici TaxID=168172 RepID=UPI002007DADD|nr:hypothetical protein Pst134EA_011879 [Puccinia striiformis f. sp. tritici]KAH9468254.1 hypothetical protein Pst134EA_011879 [Puccinia striiformis f. sp. tritici]
MYRLLSGLHTHLTCKRVQRHYSWIRSCWKNYGARKSEDDFYTITTGIKPVANHANDRSEPGMNHVVINISEVLGFRRIKGYPKDLGEILRRSGCYMLGNR